MSTIKITFGALSRLLLQHSPKKELFIFECIGNPHRVWISFDDTTTGMLNYDFKEQYVFGLNDVARKILAPNEESDNPFRD